MSRFRWFVCLLSVGIFAFGCASGGSDDCAGVDCSNHGRCAVQAGQAVCLCDPGFVVDGLTCAIDPCAASPCVYGSCHPSGKNALCDCYPGYAGLRCDTCAPGYKLEGLTCVEGSACDEDPCVYGRCHAEDGLPVCDCFLGYAGEICDACAEGYHPVDLACVSDSPCDPDPCVHGACSAASGQAVCACDPGYAGETCDACAPGHHPEGLVCVPDVAGPCDPNPCQQAHRHICQPDGPDAYTCACDPGFHDEAGACVPDEVDPCQPNPCQQVHRTVCAPDGVDGFTCACDPGWHDQAGACVADSACSPNPCDELHRTLCVLDGGGFLCNCDPGYHDEAGACVEDLICDPATTCSDHGSCTGNGLECSCDTGWDGTHCESCAAGYHPDGGACVADTLCEPNPCQQVHRTRCVEQAGSIACLCDLGYQDIAGACVGVCDTVVTYVPQPGDDIGALYIRGEFNGWAATDAFTENPDGSWTVILDLPAGDYAYKLYDAPSDLWFEDVTNPYFKWDAGIRNSRLRVRDCDAPQLRLVAQPVVDPASGSVAFQVEYVDGAQAAGADPATCEATRNDQPLAGAFDPVSSVFSVSDTGLADGKFAYRFRACDLAGRCAQRLYAPVWVEQTPFAWQDAVLYFTMTDRFENGDAGNDAPVGGQVDFKADWQGGDFSGLLDKIESGYFDALGVNAIWISSITQNTTGAGVGSDGRWYSGYHSYWPVSTGWREGSPLPGVQPVDPHFGDLADFKALVAAAHARGIRILIDFVANHVHADSPMWTGHLGDDPPWFHLPTYVCGWDQPIICWFADYLPDFEYKTLAVMDAVVEHAVWLIQETDVDGFRLDAVKHMIDDFSFTLRGRIEEAVTTTGLRFYMVGETFTGEGEGEASLIRHYVRPEMLDGQFDFPLFWATLATFLREERDFFALEGVLQQFDGFYGDWAVMSNFIGNHDVARAISHANGDIGDLWGNGAKEQGWNNPPADPLAEEPYRRLRLAWTFLMTLEGIPLIYAGDEFGLAGAGDPDNRRMMKFDNALSGHQQATLDHVASLAAARHAHPALRVGARSQLFNDGLFWAYSRVEGSDRVVVVFNRNAGPQTRSVPVAAAGLTDGTGMRDVLHDTTQTVSGGNLSVTLDGRDSAVFIQE